MMCVCVCVCVCLNKPNVFVLLAQSCPPLQTYYVDELDEQLDEALHTFCNNSIKLLPDNSLVINSIFQWFRVDFGSSEASVLE